MKNREQPETSGISWEKLKADRGLEGDWEVFGADIAKMKDHRRSSGTVRQKWKLGMAGWRCSLGF